MQHHATARRNAKEQVERRVIVNYGRCAKREAIVRNTKPKRSNIRHLHDSKSGATLENRHASRSKIVLSHHNYFFQSTGCHSWETLTDTIQGNYHFIRALFEFVVGPVLRRRIKKMQLLYTRVGVGLFACFAHNSKSPLSPMHPRGGGRSRGGGHGRGEYYRNKYGGGGRGRQPQPPQQQQQDQRQAQAPIHARVENYEQLGALLRQLDGRPYPAYHDLESIGWIKPSHHFTLHFGRTQSDPYAPPTRCRLIVARPDSLLPNEWRINGIRRLALADFLWRQLHRQVLECGANSAAANTNWSGPKGGDIGIATPVQQVLEQSAVTIQDDSVIIQFTINLPARGRSILAQTAWQILSETLPLLVQRRVLDWTLASNQAAVLHHVDAVEDQFWLQSQLPWHGLVAFIANGAILPRASGVDDGPLVAESSSAGVVPFTAPASHQVSFTLPNAGTVVAGLGIPAGVTLICGGGFHGKSTLLQTLQSAVYGAFCPGDGREYCVTDPTAVKIRAEDGRSVAGVDISMFINNLPFQKDTTNFSTQDASGSTSQASNIVEVRGARCRFYGMGRYSSWPSHLSDFSSASFSADIKNYPRRRISLSCARCSVVFNRARDQYTPREHGSKIRATFVPSPFDATLLRNRRCRPWKWGRSCC
jgi:Predicted ATPase of the ABC class